MAETMESGLLRLLKEAGATIIDIPIIEEPENEVEEDIEKD